MSARRLLVLVCAAAGLAGAYVGRVDTIGGTTYDWQTNGPQWRTLACAHFYGLHAVWMRATQGSPYPDRNMGYNFYDFSTRQWNWIDPGWMQSGIDVFTERSGFGSLAVDPQTGVAVVSAHHGAITPTVGRDVAPGAGIFEFCDGSPNLDGYQWPCVGVTASGTPHLAVIDNASQDALWHSRAVPWCNWSVPTRFTPDPTFPDHAIDASRFSDKVCVAWLCDATVPNTQGFCRVSTDDGATWQPPLELAPPDVFGGDTAESWHITGLFPFYDWSDRLHLAGTVMPVVRDTAYVEPVCIVHWCPDNAPQWSVIARVDPDSLAGSVGYNALFADRPSLGCDQYGNLFVAWEQADPLNVEPQTNCLRFGIWSSASIDNGQTWFAPRLLTDANTVSHRFPCISDLQVGGSLVDTVVVEYLMDLCAGFEVQSQGPLTENPVVCQFFPAFEVLPGVAEAGPVKSERRFGPTLVRGILRLEGGGQAALVDALGRRVMSLRDGANDVSRLAPGIYFVRGQGRGASERIVIAR
jgi:hypothetical protein